MQMWGWGLFVGANIQGTPMTMLIDTGANVTIVSENSFKCIEPSLRPQTTPVYSKLITATEAAIPFIGQTQVEIQIDNNRFFHDVLTADIQNDVILGIDFLTKRVMFFVV